MRKKGEAREGKDRHKKMTNSSGIPPKGWLPIKVGREREEQRKVVVPVARLNHPLFSQLLKESEKEYGFSQKGVIVIPCNVERFLQVQQAIDCDLEEQNSGLQLRRCTACFGA